jgi:hypothetical protein
MGRLRRGDIDVMSFEEYLVALGVDALCGVLEQRRDVLVEPVPRSIGELAQRLGGVDSLARAMPRMNRDELAVARGVALHGEPALRELAGRVGASEEVVGGVLDGLAGRGLAWRWAGRVGLPPRLADHLAAELGDFRPLRVIAAQARVDELRAAVGGLGVDPSGLRKPELVERLTALVSDPRVVTAAVSRLTPAAQRYLDLLLRSGGGYLGFGGGHGPGSPVAALCAAGLLIAGPYHQSELPRECALSLLSSVAEPITGPPAVPPAVRVVVDGRAAAEGLLRSLTNLLDEACGGSLAALKKGGIGARERSRLATRVGVTEPALAIDLAHATGLLTATGTGYRATPDYDTWREADPGLRWTRLALGWFALEIAPTSREIDDDTEVAPPLPLHSAAGMLRRALLRAAAGGRSLAAATEHLDWYCPLHGYDEAGRARKVDAALTEATVVGLVAGDRLTTLGELLVAAEDRVEAFEELADRAAELLPATRGRVVLQSDLTAVVSGQPDAAAARILAAAATTETVGAATIWRFSPASIRAALDAGHRADDLRAELTTISGRPLPQPLDYLISDVGRRHGSIRVRGSRCCITASEAETAEMLATRSLRALHLSRLAPTVVTSPSDPDKVLAALRKAGFAPMLEDTEGAVIVPSDPAPATLQVDQPAVRRRVPAAELAARLVAGAPSADSATEVDLAALASGLDEAEIALLADALDHGRDIRITYRNKVGNRTVRDIRPQELYGRWLRSWCHLRSEEREFTVSGIETVAPVG